MTDRLQNRVRKDNNQGSKSPQVKTQARKPGAAAATNYPRVGNLPPGQPQNSRAGNVPPSSGAQPPAPAAALAGEGNNTAARCVN